MRRSFAVWALSTTLLVAAAKSACAQTAADPWYSDFDAALAEAQRLDKPLLVHFYADWCGPCKQMERNVLHRDAVHAALRKHVVAVKINTDRNPEVTARFGIEALPTDLFIEPSGTKIVESTGYRSVNEYTAALARAATRYSDLVAQRQAREKPPELSPDGQAGEPAVELAATPEQQPMLDGYSPVTLWKNRRWEKGSPQFRAEYRGQIYDLASAEEQAEFNENPARFAPRFLGCDAVVVLESDRAVLGSTKYAAFYDDELYLFVDSDNRQLFKKDPDRYIKTRVVLQVDEIQTAVR
jgi:thiol-disulfide isomerase/thioredoxin/YHS domain-containing protein